jgi:hypothetical protein
MPQVKVFDSLQMVADPNPYPAISAATKAILARLGIPVPQRGARIAKALVAQATEVIESDDERQQIWDNLHAAGIVAA